MIAKLGWHILNGLMARLLAASFVLVSACWPVMAERVAFVVGNSDYDAAPDLANAANDATAIADALKRLDFKVTLMTNAGGESLWEELDRFVADAENAESAVFFYSGHAFQMSGANYLVPVTARLEGRESAKSEAWSLDGIIARLQSRSRQTLIFLDACRNDPLPAAVRGSGASADGLARVQTGVGTFVAFSTEPGGVTADGVAGAKNSPFTSALLSHIETEGISVSDMMIEVRNDVENATLRKQVPWDQSSLREQFYFLPPVEVAKQELSEADYELLAQLSPEDRKQFMDLLAQSGFDEGSLAAADSAIALSEANLEQVANETTTISAPVVETAAVAVPETELTEAELLAALEVVDTGLTLGNAPADTEINLASADAGDEPIRLAALDWTTRDISLNDVTIRRLRLAGRHVAPDTDANRALLAAIDPRLVEEDATKTVAPGDLARAIQADLRRVGCYQMAVDGSWGKGSRTALTSYYLAKKIVPKSLEPTEELQASLAAESKVVCTVRVAKSAVKTGKRTQPAVKAEPVSAGKIDIKSKKKTGKKQETAKTRITKGTIGITGAF
jgi:Caspase domain